MSFLEFQAGVERINAILRGSQLQDFIIEDRDIIFLFYNKKTTPLRLSFRTPPLFFLESDSFKLGNDSKKTPIALFLKSHFLRKTVSAIKHETDWGRRFEIHFAGGASETFYIEVILVPGFQNLGLYATDKRNDKKIFWQKPKELPDTIVDNQVQRSDFRSLDGIRQEWYSESKTNPVAPSKDSWKQDIEKKIQKKIQAIEKIKTQSEENGHIVKRLYDIGERLKYQDINQLDAEDRKWIQGLKGQDWNRDQIFKKAKLINAKKTGILARIEILQAEIESLSKDLDGSAPVGKHNISVVSKGDIDTRKLEVSNELSLYIGKSAKDNIQLLKNSKSWEIWFHLKDYPSAYAITRRNKGVPVSSSDLVKMATWFAKECFKSKKEKSPAYIEVIYTEIRFVKLVKGDRLGRVTHANTKTLRVSTT